MPPLTPKSGSWKARCEWQGDSVETDLKEAVQERRACTIGPRALRLISLPRRQVWTSSTVL